MCFVAIKYHQASTISYSERIAYLRIWAFYWPQSGVGYNHKQYHSKWPGICVRMGIPHKLRYFSLSGILLGLLLMFVSPLGAQGASSIAQGFKTTDANIVEGALVSIKPDTPNTVELSSSDRLEHLIGIVGNRPLIELSDGSSSVQVVTSGVTLALVSDINGNIKPGDKITASPIEGVGMKATESGIIVGIAQADLSAADTSERSIKAKDGKDQTVNIGLVPVQVDTVFYTGKSSGDSFVPSAFQDLANNIAGRQVSAIRVLIAALLLLLLLVSVVVLLYSSVKSSIISIGRNPLSENAVHKSLFQVGLTIVGLLAFTVILVYLILTL